MTRFKRVTLFHCLYVLVAIATFRHSAIGFASIERESIAWGALSALAVDAGMMLSARRLRERVTFWPAFGLFITALASTFTQLLFAISSATIVQIAPGAQWLGDLAQNIVDARVVLLPALLPSLSVIYAFAAKGAPLTVVTLEQKAAHIRASTDVKAERARMALELRTNGHAGLTDRRLAELVGVSESTVRNAKGAGK